MCTLALDIGTRTGYAILKDGKLFSGVADLSAAKKEHDGNRFVNMQRFLTRLQQRHGPINVIHFEEIHRHNSHRARCVYFGLLSHVESWIALQHIKPYMTGHGPGRIKKYATGKGRWTGDQKEPMLQAALKRGWETSDHNEVDALFILHYALSLK